MSDIQRKFSLTRRSEFAKMPAGTPSTVQISPTITLAKDLSAITVQKPSSMQQMIERMQKRFKQILSGQHEHHVPRVYTPLNEPTVPKLRLDLNFMDGPLKHLELKLMRGTPKR